MAASEPDPDFDFDYDLLRELTETSGVAGYEDRVREIVRRELDESCDEVRSDAMGNVVGTIEGDGRGGDDGDGGGGGGGDGDDGDGDDGDGDDGDGGGAEDADAAYEVVVAAHMDEIGFMVTHVDEYGYLEVDAIGGWDARVLRAQRVTVHTEDGDIPGIIGSPPPHTLDAADREQPDEVGDVRVDVGYDEAGAKERVRVGDPVTMAGRTQVVGNHVTGKALDDRVCVLQLVEAARRIDDPPVTVHFAATVQEEVGLRGARALGVDLDPDLAVALDVTVANDLTDFKAWEYVTRCGDGAAIKLKDSSVITNPKVHRRMRAVADERGIPHQFEVLPSGGTDTAGFQTYAGAKPVGAISVPTRYLHTPTESAHAGDVEAGIDLLVAFLETETGTHNYSL